eukprot:scaffold51102_cov37-Prasinocladus_malaysianus.AAC.2
MFGHLDPGMVKPLIEMGSFLHSEGRPEDASKHFLRAISICDRHPRKLGKCKGTLAAALAEVRIPHYVVLQLCDKAKQNRMYRDSMKQHEKGTETEQSKTKCNGTKCI